MGVEASGPLTDPLHSARAAARRWVLSGVVQGVGFRPFVYRLARRYALGGWVRNRTGQVEVVACGAQHSLQAFARDLLALAPAISRPCIERVESLGAVAFEAFRILPSEARDAAEIHVPPDYFVCEACLAELSDPADRRYRYPFINCTQCGPRYTLIKALPYDRSNTSMAQFALCADCAHEYAEPLDRRFHAEPVACPACGPQLFFKQADREVRDTGSALEACVAALRDGLVVAVKGVGGYHLMCDAANAAALARLRERKPRPHKPLALMCPDSADLEVLRRIVSPDPQEEALLRSPERPIVLVKAGRPGAIAAQIAPGLDMLGVMLPYSPLHHLLLNAFAAPLVATSANLSGEPVMTEAEQVEHRLAGVAQAFLHHNRPIVRPADDPVYRTIQGTARPLRLGRGNAPLELCLPVALEQPLLAVGGHMKATLCLAWGRRAVLSPHIGDMGTARSLEVFEQLVVDLQSLYGVRAARLVCDAHPGYATTRWARRQGLPLVEVQHHAAHAAALVGEQDTLPASDCLVFTWDGVGYGGDGQLWGGEALLGRPGRWRRVASMRPLRLPGAERAGREPWRSAVSAAWELGRETQARRLVSRAGSPADPAGGYDLLRQAWQRGLNTPSSSAVGRLFDAAAALAGVCLTASFEGQGPMWLETLALDSGGVLTLPLESDTDGVMRSDWRPLMEAMMDASLSLGARAALFHDTLAGVVVQQALAVRETHSFEYVGLCGGVFQNRRLSEACVKGLNEQGMQVKLCRRLPCNDASISFGQVMEYALGEPHAG
jgi:hydrogenase maturation protein HypF